MQSGGVLRQCAQQRSQSGKQQTVARSTACPQWYSRVHGTAKAVSVDSTGSSRASSLEPVLSTQSGAVISHLVGRKVLQLSSDLSVVPMLHPLSHSLPFAASLQVYNSCSDDNASSNNSRGPAHGGSTTTSSSLVELHYVISGSGHFTNTATGLQQPLLPGDSIICLHGAAQIAAGPIPTADTDNTSSQQHQQHQHQLRNSPAWSQLMGWLQQLHSKQQPAPLQASTTAGKPPVSHQLVTLQLLLPSELLTGQLLSHHQGHCHAVAQHLPWSSHPAAGPKGVTPLCSIHELEVCALLAAGPLHSAQPHLQPQYNKQHPHQQHVQGLDDDSSASSQGITHHQVLPSLSQQQTLKRALSEVGAFRLPEQTNRLALLFGPHSSPAVSLSFGVEVFEPGHVTPMHIHQTAHELFFVLGGKGEAVFRVDHGPGGGGGDDDGVGGVQRVAMSPGDVAVFAPGVVHGVDNPSRSDQLYCLQMMLPNEAFVEWVRSGEAAGALDMSALQRLAASASCG